MRMILKIITVNVLLSGIGCAAQSTTVKSGTNSDINSDYKLGGRVLTLLPKAVTSFGSISHNQNIYVLGGYSGTPHQYVRDGQSSHFWQYDVAKSSWRSLPSMKRGLQGLSMFSFGDNICRLGGARIDNIDPEPRQMYSIDEVVCYNKANEVWQEKKSLPKPRSSHDSVVVNGDLYVAGGWNLKSGQKSGQWHQNILKLDLSDPDGDWDVIDAPYARRALAVTSVRENLVVIGGIDSKGKTSSLVNVYNTKTGQWSEGPKFPTNGFGIGATSLGDYVYASARGGILYRWKLGEAQWQEVGALAFGRFFHQLETVDKSVVALGGISGMHTHGRTRVVEAYMPPESSNSASQVSTIMMPYPGRSKNRQAVFLRGDFLYFFGGNRSLGQHDFGKEDFLSQGYRLHLPSLKWEEVTNYPLARQTMQTVLLSKEKGLSVGGFGIESQFNPTQEDAISHADSYVYDFKNDNWIPGPKMPRGRTQFGLVTHGSEVFIFGGLNYDPKRGRKEAFIHETNVLKASLNSVDSKFEEVTELNLAKRRAFAATKLNGVYYIVGGMTEDFQLVEDCIKFDFESSSTSPFPCPDKTRLSANLIALGGKLYLVGGSSASEDGLVSDRTIEVFDPLSKTWSSLLDKPLPFGTKHSRSFVYNQKLLLVSTHLASNEILLSFVDIEL